MCRIHSQALDAWLELLPYADPGDVPEWLTPIGKRVCERLTVRDVEAVESRAIVAEVLAAVRDAPRNATEGREARR